MGIKNRIKNRIKKLFYPNTYSSEAYVDFLSRGGLKLGKAVKCGAPIIPILIPKDYICCILEIM